MEPWRHPAGAQGARAMASPETLSFYCHTCGARLVLPAPSSPFHFTLCPRCRRDYLDDSPAAPHHSPQPVFPLPPPPPPLCAVPWPLAPFTSSTPPPIPCVSSSSSSFTATRPRTLVSPCTGAPSSSIGPPPPTSSGSAASPPTPPVLSCCPERSAACREFRLLRSHDEEQRRPSAAVPPLSSPYSTACSSPLLASPPPPPPPPPFHHGELLSETESLTSEEETMSPPQDLLPPPPPPWLPLASADTWEWDDYFLNPSDSDDDSRPQPPPPPPPPPPHVSTYHAMFDMPLQVQRGGSQAAAANDAVFEFDAPLQRVGSQAAPPESIAALPTVTVTDAGLDCPVCTDPLPPAAPARRLPCGHLYHSHCIVRWLSEHSNSCPVCRRSIPTITSATSDVASSSSSSSSQPPGGRRRRSLPVPGGRRIRRICSRLLRNMEIGRDRQANSGRDRQANSSGDVHA